jgi:Rrf2 family transcriptional regulator, cysteine metabolism repressor
MKLSAKSRYGLRAMFELAMNFGKGPLSLKTIATRQQVSDQFLDQLFIQFRKAGLAKSIRGAQGGYELAKHPSDITVGNIIRALDGPMALVACLDESGAGECGKQGACITRIIWQKVQESMSCCLDSMTLQGMLDEYAKMGEANIICSQ